MKEFSSDNVCKEKVFNAIFTANAQDLFNFLYFKYQDEEEAKDVVQEVFGRLWDNCKKVPPEKARGYLFVVSNNLMKNILSKRSTAMKHQAHLKQKDTSTENPHYLMEASEFESRLSQALWELPEEQRVTLLLKRIEGKKQKEIAEMLGISEKTVEKRLYKAMCVLREKLGKIL